MSEEVGLLEMNCEQTMAVCYQRLNTVKSLGLFSTGMSVYNETENQHMLLSRDSGAVYCILYVFACCQMIKCD